MGISGGPAEDTWSDTSVLGNVEGESQDADEEEPSDFDKSAVESSHAEGKTGRDASADNDDDNGDAAGTDLYTSLITRAPYECGDDSPLVPFDEIPWIDKSLIEESMGFHRKYVTFVMLSCTSALMFGFAVKPNSAVLLRTGKLYSPQLSFERYLSTMHRIGKFFMFQVDQAKSYAALDTVRKMHVLASRKGRESHPTAESLGLSAPWKKELAAAIRQDLAHIDTSSAPQDILTWDPSVPVSQFDMVITQFGFFGTMWLYPKMFGVKDRFEEMRGVIHTWAIFGRMLGIKDEYNICIKPDPALFDKLFRNIVLESLKTMDETVITIQAAFTDALSKRVPFLRYKAMLYCGLQELEGYKGDNLWKLMSWADVVAYRFLQGWMWMIRNVSVFRVFMNIVTVLWIQFQCWLHLPATVWK